eukprot:2282460-Amphidinium_carterae.1
MSDEQYHKSVHSLSVHDNSLHCSTLPRTGPIPDIRGCPQSQSTVPIHPFHSTAEDVMDPPYPDL